MLTEREVRLITHYADMIRDERDLFELGYATHLNRGAGLYLGL